MKIPLAPRTSVVVVTPFPVPSKLGLSPREFVTSVALPPTRGTLVYFCGARPEWKGSFYFFQPPSRPFPYCTPPCTLPSPLVPEEAAESAVEHSRYPEGEILLEAVSRMSHRVRFAPESAREEISVLNIQSR